ncbi:CCR4-NOT transcription complex subunit 10-like [Coffea eugenioides]|uniref:Uncharacterized protein n=1 Tax=Coffea arabica TaxID=13443 RepID=A0A6P6SZI9_COFAR|nr:CCR4-NOT transcription complex subunit 10 [Coffea arabica]XP_027176601.1 CCR4-NOT transcription complex subunit 10-like [Coffea eugenioides]XP_027179832.1 CCR4-NOT transcription complex subunit 10-like [Coffea eugenioides]
MDSSSSMSSPAIMVGDSNNNVSSNNRDGALSPTAAASLRGSMEDDVALSVAAGLAKEAALLFQAGKFAECVSVLKQLLHKKEDDPKILHNIAIAEYFQDGCSDPKKLLEELNNVKKRSEALAHASEEQQTESVGSTSRLAVGSKGNSNVSNSYSVTSSLPVVYTDEFDTSVTIFNTAVIWFHLHEYAKSYRILDALYQNIEPIDEGTALRICLLLLDVALFSNHASRSADVISYVEKVFCANSMTNQVDNGSSLHQPTMVSKSASFSATIPGASNSDSASSANVLESSLSRTLSEEALEDESLQLLSSLDIGGENLPRPSSLQSSNDVSRIQTDDSISTVDLRLKLHLYKVSFLLLTRNIKAAKREVKMAMNIARGKDYTWALYLKSQLEYARGNHRKACKLLMASSNLTEIGISSMYYNNFGCIYYRLGKYHASSVFFSKALRYRSTLLKEKPVKLATFSQVKSWQMAYNSGLSLLSCGKPVHAAQCFYKAGLTYYNRPLLWLRIAECCLMALEKGLLKSNYSSPSDGSDVKVHVVGKGKWRQLALEDGVSRTGKFDSVGRDDFSFGNGRLPELSMSLARQCLLNALHLLESSDSKYLKSGLLSDSAAEGSESGDSSSSKATSYKNLAGGDPKLLNAAVGSGQANTNGEVKEQKCGNGQNTSLLNSVSDYEDICRKENQMIEQALLADMAYVELELENPLKALSTAKSLLKLFECSKIYVFLGHLYAAEALCLLNRPKEAAEHLSVYVTGGSNFQLPYSQDDLEKWSVEKIVDFEEPNGGPSSVNASSSDEFQGFTFLKPEEARGTICANLALLAAELGDPGLVQDVMQATASALNSPHVILATVYLDLLQGKTQDALAKLKQCNRIRFLPGRSTLDGSS